MEHERARAWGRVFGHATAILFAVAVVVIVVVVALGMLAWGANEIAEFFQGAANPEG